MILRTLLLLCVVIGSAIVAKAEDEHACLFRAVVVPLSSPKKVEAFAHSREDFFSIRLRVTKILTGDGPIEVGRDYLFGMHSIVMTFGIESLSEIEGQEFAWFVTTKKIKEGVVAATLFRGEAFEKSINEEKKKEANQALLPTPTAVTPPAAQASRQP